MAPRGYRTGCNVHKKSRTEVLNKDILHAKTLLKIPLLSLYPLEGSDFSQKDLLATLRLNRFELMIGKPACRASE